MTKSYAERNAFSKYLPFVTKVFAKYKHLTIDPMVSSGFLASICLSTGRGSGEAPGEALLLDGDELPSSDFFSFSSLKCEK